MPAIVLLPGMDGTGDLFDSFCAALGDAFEVTVVRYPADGRLGYDQLEAIARRSLPSSGKFFILGESFSGPIAVAIAASRPKGLAGVILCCSFVRTPRPALAPLRGLASRLPLKLAPERMLSYFLLGNHATPMLRSRLGFAMAQVATPALQSRLHAVATVDVTEKLKALSVPLLYLRATHDRLVSPASGDYIAGIHPGIQIASIDAPHFLLQCAPAEAARIVTEFAADQLKQSFIENK